MTGGCSRGDIMEDWELGTLFWILVWGIVFVFVLNIVDLQCCVSFCSTAQGIRYICVHVYICIHKHILRFFAHIGHYIVLKSSLCYIWFLSYWFIHQKLSKPVLMPGTVLSAM